MTIMKIYRRVSFCLLLCIGLNAMAEVQFPQGEFYRNLNDLQVKVMGGTLKIGRTLYQGEWTFNRAWAPVVLDIPADNPAGGTITRNNTEYANPGVSRRPISLPDGSPGYHVEIAYTTGARKTMRIVRSGDIAGGATDSEAERTLPNVRWEDIAGNWIDYALTSAEAVVARIEAYGDRNGVIARFTYDDQGRLSGILDRGGAQVVWYDYDPQGHLQYVRDAENHWVEYRYIGERLSEVIDLRGHSWQYVYINGLISTLTDPEGRITEIVYDNTKRVAKVILRDSDGNRVETGYRYDYDKSKKEYYVQVRNPVGSVMESWYNPNSQLIRRSLNGIETYAMSRDTGSSRESRTLTDRRGLETVKSYDEWENLIKTTYPDGSIASAGFKPGTDLLTESVDELGRVTQYEYDNNGNLIRLTEAADTPQQRITEYRYDSNGLLFEKKVLADAVSQEAITGYGYDDRGNLTTITDPEGGITRFTHNIRGDVLTVIDPNSKTWTLTYDPEGNLETETDPLNRTVTRTYDKVGNLLSRRDARQHTTTYTYNLQDKRISETDPLSHTSEIRYDVAGRLTAIADPLGNQHTIGYDLEGKPIVVKDPAGNPITLGYGEGTGQGGGLNGITDYPGLLNRIQYPSILQTYHYDKRNRLTQAIDHLDDGPAITALVYDAAGNTIQVTDAENRVTQYRYDALNRLSEIIDPLNQSTRFTYDNRDNLLSVTDPNGHTTAYAYDRADRQTGETRPGGQTISYTYDPVGNLLTQTDPDGRRTVNTYDDAGQLQQQDHYPPGAATPERTVTYTYDENGNLTGYGDGSISATYVYDENNRKTQETTDYGPFSLTHHYSYDAAGNKQTYTGPDNVTLTYHWNKGLLSRIELPNEGSLYYNRYKWSRPEKLTWPGGGTREIAYDAGLKPTRILDTDPGQVPLLDYQYLYDKTGNIAQKTTQQTTTDYSYDQLQRLTEAAGQGETEGWDYDPNGNRIADNLSPGTWQYDDNDRLLESPSATYTYDEAGNTLTKTEGGVTVHYIYNAEGRLSRIEDATQAVIAEYAYDPLGRRYKKTTQTETLYFHYTDEGLSGEFNAVGSPVRQYGYQPDSTWTTDPLYQKTAQGYAYYRNDHLGTPQQLVRANGAKVWAGEYWAFGGIKSETGSWENRLRFPGQYLDQESGNYYNYFRDYDPKIGRYFQSDPIGLGGGINTYAYVGGNPHIYMDPYGLFGWADMPTLPQGVIDFSAGFGDSMSFGITKYIRAWRDIGGVNKCSGFYKGGEVADLVFEVGTLGLSAGLKALAANASRTAVRGAAQPFVNAFRKVNELKGGFVHHSNPLFGHPGGMSTLFPTGGLPARIHSGAWNLRWFPDRPSHNAAHKYMSALESAWRAFVNPGTTGIRAARDAAEGCACQ